MALSFCRCCCDASFVPLLSDGCHESPSVLRHHHWWSCRWPHRDDGSSAPSACEKLLNTLCRCFQHVALALPLSLSLSLPDALPTLGSCVRTSFPRPRRTSDSCALARLVSASPARSCTSRWVCHGISERRVPLRQRAPHRRIVSARIDLASECTTYA